MIRRSTFASLSPFDISILTNPPTQWRTLFPLRPFRFFCFSPSIWVQPVCIREKRNGSKTRGARARLLSPVQAKNTPPLRAPPLHVFSLSSPRTVLPSSFAHRSFLLAFSRSPLHALYLARSPVDYLCPSLAPNRRSLAINKKRKKKEKITSDAGVSGVE